jgi:large subunit ribosomal protein L18
MALTKTDRRFRIRKRIRKRITGTDQKPRLSIFRSNRHIYAQIINDEAGTTLLAASSLEKDILDKKNITKNEQAKLVGKLIAEKAKQKGLTNVVFDRGGYLYHGRVKELANSAREAGLKF